MRIEDSVSTFFKKYFSRNEIDSRELCFPRERFTVIQKSKVHDEVQSLTIQFETPTTTDKKNFFVTPLVAFWYQKFGKNIKTLFG